MSSKQNYNPNASASMLGYIYQVQYALYMCLEMLTKIDDPDEHNISLEKLDDIAFDQNGSVSFVNQIKGHDLIESEDAVENLTDRSSDIWSTFRVWVKLINDGDAKLGKTVFRLITTQSYSQVSVASYLSDTKDRDPAEALKLLQEISTETSNKTNKEAYEAFQSLSPAQLNIFIDSVYMIGQSEDIDEINQKISRYCRQYVARNKATPFAERLNGKWNELCTSSLQKNPTGVINLGEVQALIDSFRPEYRDDNLPAEFADNLPKAININKDNRKFVQQLRLINLPNIFIKSAIIDYFQSFKQRDKWAADGLLNPGELGKYDRRLIRKWAEFREEVEMLEPHNTEEEKLRAAYQLYKKCRSEGTLPIRRDFIEEYVAKGSYHMLSDDQKIGWHFNYLDYLKAQEEDDAA